MKAGFAFSHPAHVIACGFGTGLAPLAPGTFGSLLGWGIGWALAGWHAGLVFSLLAILFVLGLWACDITGRHLGVSDHRAMVWDEVVAFALVIAIVPAEAAWQLGAFIAFRFFDIAKPPPIREFERRYGGGFGVMFDDVVAAGYTVLVLAAAKRFLFP